MDRKYLFVNPKGEMFQKAMMEAGVRDKQKCLFVDDSFGIAFLGTWVDNS